MKKKIRLAITGPMGRMGQTLIHTINQHTSTDLTVVLVEKNHPLVDQDIGKHIGIGNIGILISDQFDKIYNKFDVLIDFTNPKSTLEYVKLCKKFKKNIVIGTTGFSTKQINTITSCSENIGVILSSNFSVGINLLFQLIKQTTKIIGNISDIDIIDHHHRNKKDAPSGTALSIGKIVSNIMNLDLNKDAIYYKKGISEVRKKNKIGFSIIRSGHNIGKHTIMFSTPTEEIQITHSAFDRKCFAQGAIQAALWIYQKQYGLFKMKDVLSSVNNFII